MKRKLVAGLLAMAVAMTMLLPVSAFAEELPEPVEVVQQDEKAQDEVVEETKDEFVEESEDQAVGETEGKVVEETEDETVEEPKDEVVEKTEDEVVEETEDEMVEATEDEAVQATEEKSVAVQPSLLSAVSLLSGDANQSEIYIEDSKDLVEAIKGQADNQTWIFTKAGTYDAYNAENDTEETVAWPNAHVGGYVAAEVDSTQTGAEYAFPIYVDGLTIKKGDNVEGDVILTSSMDPGENGGWWNYQNFITISGSNVTIENVDLQANPNSSNYYGGLTNKVIEVVGDASDFTLENVDILPLSTSDGKVNSGSINFATSDLGDSVIENVTMHGLIGYWQDPASPTTFEGNLTITNLEQDYTSHIEAGSAQKFGVTGLNEHVTVDDFTMIVDDSIDSRQIFNDSLLDGSTIQMQEGTYEIGATLNINSSVNIVGAGADKTIFRATAEPAVLIQVAGGDVDFSMSGVYVKGCEENTHQNSSALMIGSGSLSSTGTISIEDCKFTDFTKNSITVKGGTANITRNEIVCKGYPGAAGNGIQVDMGAEATISNNKISGYASQNSTWSATGVLALRDGKVTELTGNTLQNCDAAVSLSTVYDEGDTASIPAPAAIMSANTFTGCDTSVSYQLDTEGNLAEILKNAQPGTSVSLYGSYTLDSDVTVKDGVSRVWEMELRHS